MKVKCPHCSKKHDIALTAVIPDEQRMSITIDAKSEYIAADAVGKLLVATTKALQAVARNIGGQVAVFVQDIQVSKNKVKVDVFVSSVKKKAKKL